MNKLDRPITTKFNNQNQSLLHFAILTTKNEEVYQFLIDSGIDKNSVDIFGQTPLALAITGHNQTVIADLMNLTVDLRMGKSEAQATPIPDINYPAVNCLLKNSAETTLSPGCLSALHLASYLGDPKLVNMLLDHGAEINEQMHDEKTPLIIALLMKHVSVATILLEHGADPLLPLTNPPSLYIRMIILPAHVAMTVKCSEILPTLAKYMVEAGDSKIFNSMVMSESGSFQQCRVSRDDIDQFFKLLTDLKLDINGRDEEGRTPLHNLVCHTDDLAQFVDIFLKHGAELNAVDEDGNTPLHLAIEQNNLHMACRLINRWADQTILNNDGMKAADFIDEDTDIIHSYRKVTLALAILKGQENLDEGDEDEEDERYHSQMMCDRIKEELEQLRKTKVETSVFNYSLYDVLTVPMHKLVCCARNRTFLDYFDKYAVSVAERNKYAQQGCYDELILYRFELAKRRYDLLYSNLGALNDLVKRDYPDFVAETVFHFLSNEDIQNVVKAQQLALA